MSECPPLFCPARICPFRVHCPSSNASFVTLHAGYRAGRPAGTRHLHPRSSNTQASIIPSGGRVFSNTIPLRWPVMTYCVSAILVV